MSFAADFVLSMRIGLFILPFLGCVVLSLFMSKTGRKYREFVDELKKQNRYAEWAKQHSRLILVQNVFQYSGVLFLLALLVYFSIVKDFISAPRMILIVSETLIYLFWPFSFVSLLVISRFYKKIPELWSEPK
jgi:hypothetical protein